MAHKRFRECDGVRYVTNRIKSNPELIKTVSDAPKKPKAKTLRGAVKIIELNRQVKEIAKLLKSDKPKSSAPQKYNYPIIDRRV